MRVLTIGSDPTLFAPESAARERMRFYASGVDELHIISPGPRGAMPLQDGNVWLYPITLNKGMRLIAFIRRARALMRTHTIDVVSAQDPFLCGLAALIAVWGTQVRIQVQVHTDLTALSLARRFCAFMVLGRADMIRVVSPKIEAYLKSLHVRAPISVLPVYIDLTRFRAVKRHSHPRFARTILWIGRFEKEKNPAAALTLLAQVRAQGIDAGLILLGRGSLEPQLRAQAAALAPSVEFPGWHDPLPYLSLADVVVSTSQHESYGASIIEALAAGVPVVAPDVGVARAAGACIAAPDATARVVSDVLRHGRRGELLLDPLGPEEWKQAWVAGLRGDATSSILR